MVLRRWARMLLWGSLVLSRSSLMRLRLILRMTLVIMPLVVLPLIPAVVVFAGAVVAWISRRRVALVRRSERPESLIRIRSACI